MSFNKKPLKARASEMINETFIYGGKIHCILSINFDDMKDRMTVTTNRETYVRNYESGLEFLGQFKPQEVPAVSVPAVVDNNLDKMIESSFEKDETMATDIMTILRETLDKVRSDKDYIPQATVVVNTTNSMVNLAKLKIQMRSQYSTRKRA